MAWREGGSPQNSLVDLTQFLWQQKENLSDVSGIWLDYQDFTKNWKWQLLSTMVHFSSQISQVLLLCHIKTQGSWDFASRTCYCLLATVTFFFFFKWVVRVQIWLPFRCSHTFLKILEQMYIILECPGCFLTRTDKF